MQDLLVNLEVLEEYGKDCVPMIRAQYSIFLDAKVLLAVQGFTDKLQVKQVKVSVCSLDKATIRSLVLLFMELSVLLKSCSS